MASSNVSPAIFMDLLLTIPQREITAISVVPPPTSTTILPYALVISSPAPIAAAMGSSIIYTSFAPTLSAASITALLSTSVIPLGTHIIMRGL
jgi:hypothetical protein